MKTMRCLTAILLASMISLPSFAQDKDAPAKDATPAAKKDDKAPAGQPDEAQMMAMMMELAKPGENHKLLQNGVGTWTYKVKFWMNPDPAVPPSESTGTTVARSVMGGRYVISEHTGKMTMPGPDGKVMDMDFNGMAVEGYDNVKKKFLSTWVDNMGTGIIYSEGDYDPATRTLTYHAEYEPMPGMKTKIREVIKITDKDHHTFEYYEERGGKEVKTMEIVYTRK
jgi:hypothetical protein